MTIKIAFNPEDRFVVTIGNRILVVTQGGSVFGLDVSNNFVGNAFQLSGPKVASNPQDRFLVAMGNTLIVTTQSGEVFGHEISNNTIGEPFRFNTGSQVAFNPQDKHLLVVGNKLVVITEDGDVFGHEVSGRDVSASFKFTGSRAAFNPQDRFVVGMGNRIIVTTQDGGVFGHDISDHDVSQPFKFTGSRMGFNPPDRFLFALGSMLVVSVQNGDAFGAAVSDRDVGPIILLNPQDVLVFDAVDGGSTSLTSSLPLGGSAHLVLDNKGNWSLSTHAHDSGFDNINYSLATVLMSASGLAFTFQVQGSVEGTSAGLPFGTPNRNDDRTISGSNPALKEEFERLRDAILAGKLAGTDTLLQGIGGLIGQALNAAAAQFGQAGAKAVIALL